MSDFYSYRQIKKSRKEHMCRCCQSIIQKGEAYTLHAGVYEGNFYTYKTCPQCEEILNYIWHDLGWDEVDVSSALYDVISEEGYDTFIFEQLAKIKHPSERVLDLIEDYKEDKNDL